MGSTASAKLGIDPRRHRAAGPEVRRVLRNRARYEVANNSYAKGIVLTLANDAIGTERTAWAANRKYPQKRPCWRRSPRPARPVYSMVVPPPKVEWAAWEAR